MKWIRKNWIFFALAVLVFLLVQQCNKEQEPEILIREVKVQVPIIEKVFDTILIPQDSKTIVVREIDSSLYREYRILKDSIKKDSLYKDAITIREYTQSFEDSIQTIEVYSKSRGHLLEQSLSYKTKPRELSVIDTIELKKKIGLGFGMELGIPTSPKDNRRPAIKFNLVIKTKKTIYPQISYDTQGTFWIGGNIKLF